MNAGGVDKACKSRVPARATGKRVSNTWVTYPRDRHNSSKDELIPDNLVASIGYQQRFRKKPLREWPAAYQLVGGVMAYQGDDG